MHRLGANYAWNQAHSGQPFCIKAENWGEAIAHKVKKLKRGSKAPCNVRVSLYEGKLNRS
jgi:hypothetical protein